MKAIWPARRRSVDVPCRVEVEHSIERLHACVDLDGLEVGPGDRVLIHGVSADVPFGESRVVHRRATIIRAGTAERLWTKFSSYLALMDLFEVGFSERRAP